MTEEFIVAETWGHTQFFILLTFLILLGLLFMTVTFMGKQKISEKTGNRLVGAIYAFLIVTPLLLSFLVGSKHEFVHNDDLSSETVVLLESLTDGQLEQLTLLPIEKTYNSYELEDHMIHYVAAKHQGITGKTHQFTITLKTGEPTK